MTYVVGLVPVPAAGTLVRLTSALPTLIKGQRVNPEAYTVHAFLVQAMWNNTGRVFLGSAALVASTGVGLCWAGAIPTSNSIPAFSSALTLSPAGVDLSDFYLDAAVSGEGVLLTLEIP
jgi:hypothetical protein